VGSRRGGTGICAVKLRIDVTNRLLARYVAVIRLAEDQRGLRRFDLICPELSGQRFCG
jgi:hypothetical protein